MAYAILWANTKRTRAIEIASYRPPRLALLHTDASTQVRVHHWAEKLGCFDFLIVVFNPFRDSLNVALSRDLLNTYNIPHSGGYFDPDLVYSTVIRFCI